MEGSGPFSATDRIRKDLDGCRAHWIPDSIGEKPWSKYRTVEVNARRVGARFISEGRLIPDVSSRARSGTLLFTPSLVIFVRPKMHTFLFHGDLKVMDGDGSVLRFFK